LTDFRRQWAQLTARFGHRSLLSNDIRGQFVFQKTDPVPQNQLSLFQPLNLQLIAGPDRLQRRDRRIKIAMFLSQALDLSEKNASFLLVQRLSHR
jgi:hypothetical protein